MLIEQIIKFELRGPGPLSRTCTPKTVYFYEKSKISKANTQVIIYSEKYSRRQQWRRLKGAARPGVTTSG